MNSQRIQFVSGTLNFDPAEHANLPSDIQWCPPGVNTVQALLNDKPATVTIRADAATAARLDAQLQQLLAKAENGEGVRPFIDFDHQGGVAAAWPERFYWGGNDPKNGGIRVRLSAWSAAGEEAILGRNYQAFSPTLLRASAESEEISGIGLNIGGLVNNPAFEGIQTFFANSESGGLSKEVVAPKNTTESNNMNPLIHGLVELGLVQDDTATEAVALEQVTAALNELKAEKEKLIAQCAELEKQLQDNCAERLQTQKSSAEAIVNAAILSGKLPAKNEALRERWVQCIAANPAQAELLHAMPSATLLQPVVTASRVVRESDATQETARGLEAVVEALKKSARA